MPAGKPDLPQTRPLQSCALPHHRAPAAHRNPSRHPFHRHPHPLRDRPCHSSTNSRLSHLRPSTSVHVRSVAPTPIAAPNPNMSKVTTAPPTQHTMPMPADDGDQYRVLVVAPDSPLPGPPN